MEPEPESVQRAESQRGHKTPPRPPPAHGIATPPFVRIWAWMPDARSPLGAVVLALPPLLLLAVPAQGQQPLPEATETPEPTAPEEAQPDARPSLELGDDADPSLGGFPVVSEEPVTHVEWNPRWRKAGFWDTAIVATGAIVIISDMQLEYGSNSADWSRPVLWDEDVRDALRLDVAGERDTAATISDAMMMGSLIHNVIFDNLVVAWVLHGQPELAGQMSIMNAEAYAIALSLTSIVKSVTSRARPLVEECDADPNYSRDCQSLSRYRSFFSGHAATTAVGAGLLCAHHLNVPLYDDGPLDVGTCVMGIALTMATGALRIASDNHWATDVTAGHLVGFASGFLVPTLLNYREGDHAPERNRDEHGSEAASGHVLLLPRVSESSVGLQLLGTLQ